MNDPRAIRELPLRLSYIPYITWTLWRLYNFLNLYFVLDALSYTKGARAFKIFSLS